MTHVQPQKWVYAFGASADEAEPGRKDILGGKGASLAAMSRAGLPVPPGFILSAECCPLVAPSLREGEDRPAERGGYKQAQAWPPGLEEQVRAAVARLEQVTGRPFGRGPRPLLVAVRSGAAVSMPGMMDTILNCGLHAALAPEAEDPARFWRDYADHVRMFARSVAGPRLHASESEPQAQAAALLRQYEEQTGRPFPQDPSDALRQCINAVFASWHSERAVVYRQHHDVQGLLGTAVTVQAMFASERAGVLFTANPNALDAGEMVIEAAWGLGEAVVSGAVTPDVYVVDARSLAVKQETPGHRPAAASEPALAPEQVRRIAELGRQVEGHFGVPCDIEWGLAGGKLALLQSRPIRGLDVLEEAEVCRHAEIQRLAQLAAGERVVWVAHNLAETLPAPTPLTWDLIRQFMSGSGGYGRMYQDFGYRPSARVRAEGFLELIGGRIYADPRRAAGLFWDGVPLEYDPAELAGDPGLIEQPPRRFVVEKAGLPFFLRLPALAWTMLRAARMQRRARARALAAFTQDAVPRLLRYVEETRREPLAVLGPRELIEELHRRRRFVLDEFGKESLKPGFFGGLAQQALTKTLSQLVGAERGAALVAQLTTGLEHDTTVEQNILLYRVAKGEATLDEFLAAYGHRAVNEMELAQPRWREDPAYVQRVLQSYRRPGLVPPDERHAQQVAARRQAEAELPALLAECGGSSLLEAVLPDLLDAQQLLPYRETGKHYLMMGYETLRAVLLELAGRWGLGRGLFFLHLDELERFEAERDQLVRAIAARQPGWRAAQSLSLQPVIDSEDLEELGRPRPRSDGTALAGRPLAAGSASGVARVLFDPQEAGDLGTGYILVCPSTDPGWTPLFVHARGLVVERGGLLSHGAIVARDFGIPAVACEGATERIPDGARVEIDGARGTVTLVAPRNGASE